MIPPNYTYHCRNMAVTRPFGAQNKNSVITRLVGVIQFVSKRKWIARTSRAMTAFLVRRNSNRPLCLVLLVRTTDLIADHVPFRVAQARKRREIPGRQVRRAVNGDGLARQ